MKKRPMRTREDESQIVNLTPLIDVVFVVLIMFIMIAPLMELEQVQLVEGSKEVERESFRQDQNKTWTIHVKKDNTIWINKQAVDKERFREVLAEIYSRFPDKAPIVFHDKEAAFGTYQFVKDSLAATGYTQMDLILK